MTDRDSEDGIEKLLIFLDSRISALKGREEARMVLNLYQPEISRLKQKYEVR